MEVPAGEWLLYHCDLCSQENDTVTIAFLIYRYRRIRSERGNTFVQPIGRRCRLRMAGEVVEDLVVDPFSGDLADTVVRRVDQRYPEGRKCCQPEKHILRTDVIITKPFDELRRGEC